MHRGKFRMCQIVDGPVDDSGNVPFIVGVFDPVRERVTAADIVSVNIALTDGLTVALIDPFRRTIRRKNQKRYFW